LKSQAIPVDVPIFIAANHMPSCGSWLAVGILENNPVNIHLWRNGLWFQAQDRPDIPN
jgi:hypothetical protein